MDRVMEPVETAPSKVEQPCARIAHGRTMDERLSSHYFGEAVKREPSSNHPWGRGGIACFPTLSGTVRHGPIPKCSR
jgi:hypothetical protein